MMSRIAVVMSTYNGEAYVAEQINSILKQKGVVIELYIRDDGSKDGTVKVIEQFAETYENVHLINKGNFTNLGVTKSFNQCLKYAFNNENDVEYFAFADQDDYWLPQKLSVGINAIQNSTNQKGAMYYSNLIFVDKNLNEIGRENIKYYGDYMEIVWRSLASGCTMVFNRKLLEFWNKYDAKARCLHDAWLYRLAKCIGSDIFFGKDSYILYRQHDHNVMGSKATMMFNTSAENLIESIKRRFSPRVHNAQNQIREIYRVAHSDMVPDAVNKSIIVMNYNKSVKMKLKMFTFEGIRKRPLKMRLLWYNKVLFNMI